MLTPSDPLLFFGGAALCLAATAIVAIDVTERWQARVRQRRQSDADVAAFREKAAATAVAARARLATRLAWEGRRLLRVSAVVDESPDVKSIYLTAPEGGPLPPFLPGQYLTLSLPADPSGDEVVRCYSLSDRPRTEYYRLSVKRIDAPQQDHDAPPGVASNWLHTHARSGIDLACEAPRGVFFYSPAEPRPAVLIGSGVGVTPLVSMLASLDAAKATTPTHAFLGFRDGASHLFAEEVGNLAHGNETIDVCVAYSRPRAEDRLGVDFSVEGHVTLELIRRRLPSNNYEFFVCGPSKMMQTLVPELLAWGVPEDAIHYEAFGPASVNTAGGLSLAEQAIGSTVRFSADGEPLVWDDACTTLLDLAESAGVPLSSGCRAGNCGACRVRLLEGRVATMKRPGLATDDDECLTCISVPAGPVSLEV